MGGTPRTGRALEGCTREHRVQLDHHPHQLTETDLIARGGMPLRVGLLAELEEPVVDAGLAAFEALIASDVMTPGPVTARDDEPLERAVDRMVERDLKRLPVVDGAGHLVGMLSRVDVLRTVAHTSPDWQAFPAHIEIHGNAQAVGTLATSEAPTVVAGTPLSEVLDALEAADAQRAAVVNQEGLLLGIVSDRYLGMLSRDALLRASLRS